jgi:hypothetical protein
MEIVIKPWVAHGSWTKVASLPRIRLGSPDSDWNLPDAR